VALTFRTALSEIERALVRALRLALLKREVVADISALRAFEAGSSSGTSSIVDGQPIFVTATGLNWQWSRSSTEDDDGFGVIRPNAVAVDAPGRWLATSCTRSSGYCTAVHYWQGETKKGQFQARMLAQRPSVAVIWEGSGNDPRSTIPGAIYDYPCDFSVWCVDENLRPDYEAMLGSSWADDAEHPGAIAVLGDVKKTLADENKQHRNVLGLGGGVKLLQLGEEAVEDADLDNRVVVLSLAVSVLGSVENPDDPVSDHQPIETVYGQPALGNLGEQDELDADNHVVSGLLVLPQLGLTATPDAGSVVIDGETVAVTPGARTFSAWSDTYIDVAADGSVTFVETPAGGAAPSVTTGCLRTTRVTTDGAGIVGCDPIAARSAPFGDPNKLLP